MDTAVDVQLLTHTPDPIRVMYVAFRTCYSKFTPQQLWADIESGKISEEKMKTFTDFPYVVPETWEQAGLREEYVAFMRRVGELYDQALKAGVPAEDARFLLPNAASTNLTFTVNYEEFLHVADLRLCWRAQWEIRHMWAKARNALKAQFPELAKPVQPKCGDQRMGYCDEPLAEYLKCPLGARRIRLHKDEIVAAAKTGRTLESTPLTEDDLALLTPRPEFEKVPAGSPS